MTWGFAACFCRKRGHGKVGLRLKASEGSHRYERLLSSPFPSNFEGPFRRESETGNAKCIFRDNVTCFEANKSPIHHEGLLSRLNRSTSVHPLKFCRMLTLLGLSYTVCELVSGNPCWSSCAWPALILVWSMQAVATMIFSRDKRILENTAKLPRPSTVNRSQYCRAEGQSRPHCHDHLKGSSATTAVALWLPSWAHRGEAAPKRAAWSNIFADWYDPLRSETTGQFAYMFNSLALNIRWISRNP